MTAYYNEIDPFAAQWLRNLIAAGHIASGIVDERNIKLVQPEDVREYEQCHFFAGIGGWSYALRLAGWDDERPVWTGSCPCQPFSAAGKGKAEADERHLWPEFRRLIAKRHPAVVFGEQVASRLGRDWLAAVQTDLEDMGYATAGADLCAASVEAPHMRQRLWWVADANGRNASAEGLQRGGDHGQQPQDSGTCGWAEIREQGIVGNADDQGSQGRSERGDSADQCAAGQTGVARRLANSKCGTSERRRYNLGNPQSGVEGEAREWKRLWLKPWASCEFIPCRDGKARPVEPGTFPLAHGISGRVGRLRAYGNAIVPQVASEFVKAFMECRP